MANVIVAFWSTNGRVMYDAIRDSFLKNGNNVMYLDMFNYISFTHWGESYVINNEDKEYLWKKISQFKPDVVLSFNNIFPHFFVEKLNCPICVADADRPSLGFWHKDILKKNKDRYIFLGFQKTSKELYTDLFGDIKNYFYWPAATTIKNTHSKKLNNISFIGSSFLYLGIIVPNHNYNFVKDKKLFNDIIIAHKSLNGEFCDNFNKLKTLCFPKEQDSYINKIYQYLHSNHISGIERISYLTVLSDLGLKIYGLDLWRELLYFDINLANCFDDTPISTFQDNLKIYNDSKIAVNISHKQATSAFSWRVMDIMASGACLLMEDKPDWRELFEKYLSKETLETVIYKDRFDMRKKAIKLLNDEELRERCVADLNKAIEKNGRWEIRFKELETYTGVKLLNSDNKNSEIIFMQKTEQKTIQNPNKKDKGFIQRLKLKNRIKIFIYSLFLALAQIPILDLFQKKKRRNKLLNKINKYWR